MYNCSMMSETRSSRRRFRAGLPVLLLFMLAGVLPLTAPPPAAAEPPAGSGKVVILLVDRVGIAEFPSGDTPFCSGLAGRWSAGLMVTRTGERQTGREPDNGAEFVTLGAGARSRGAVEAGWSYDESEAPAPGGGSRSAGELYRAFTGRRARPGSAVLLGFQQVFRNNGRARAGGKAGLMGSLLAAGGMRASVAGNADTLNGRSRFAPLVICDDRGTVGRSALSGASVRADFPGGLRTDYPGLLSDCSRLLPVSDVLVVDTGDTGRIDRERARTADSELERERALALGRFDRFAERVASMLDLESSVLLILSPGAPAEARAEGDYLTPVIAAGGGFGRGLLTSRTTRRDGLVNNLDVLPTVLEHLGVSVTSDVVGSRMSTSSRKGGGLGYLRQLDAQFKVTRKARWPVVIAYLALVASLVALTVLSLPGVRRRLGRPPLKPGRTRLIAAAATALLAGPLSLLAVSAFRYGGYLFPAVFCAGFMAVVGSGAYFLCGGRERVDPVVSVCLLTAGVILADALLGGRLVMLPLLGDSALEGARMYGLSNSIVAVLLAVSIWAAAGLAGPDASRPGLPRGALLAALLALCFLTGFGRVGANVGGFIASTATCLTFLAATSARGLGARTAGWIAGATAAGTAAMILLDAAVSQTHAGKVASGGSPGVVHLVRAKLSILAGQMSFLLLPAVLLIVATAAAVLWLRAPRSPWGPAWERYPWRIAAFYSLAVGSLVSLVFNDTGIAMMGMIAVVSSLAACYYATANASNGTAKRSRQTEPPNKRQTNGAGQ